MVGWALKINYLSFTAIYMYVLDLTGTLCLNGLDLTAIYLNGFDITVVYLYGIDLTVIYLNGLDRTTISRRIV